MNVKKIIIPIAALIVAFLISLVASYFIYPMIHPNAIKTKKSESALQISKKTPRKSDRDIIKDLRIRIKGLSHTIDSLNTQQKKNNAHIDSLNLILKKKTALITNLKKEKLSQKENVKFIANSLLNLDEDKLAPIVNKLSNQQLLAIYNTATNMQRQKLLQSLTPDKAADIVKKVML